MKDEEERLPWGCRLIGEGRGDLAKMAQGAGGTASSICPCQQ